MKFYDKAIIIDRLINLSQITKKDIDELSSFLDDESVRNYFYHNLKNVKWFPHLKKMREFSKTPVMQTKDGNSWLPDWPVVEYLTAVAKEIPNEVVEVVKSVTTDNSRVIWKFALLGKELPPEYTAQLVPLVEKWLELKYRVSTNFDIEILEWIKHLVNGEQVQPALELFRVLTKPQKLEKAYLGQGQSVDKIRPDAISVLDQYSFKELIEKYLPCLINIKPFEVSSILQDSLSKAIDIERMESPKHDLSALWRPAIEDSDQNWRFDDFKDLLAEASRDTLQACVSKEQNKSSELIKSYLGKEYSIFRRLALHTIRTNLNIFFELGKDLVLKEDNLLDTEINHEYLLLLQAIFGKLSISERKQLIEYIFAKPYYDEDAQVDIQESQKKYWIVSKLSVIEKELDSETKRTYEQFVKETGPSAHPTYPFYHESFRGEESPKTKQELSEMTPDEVFSFLRDFKPQGTFRGPTLNGLARTLQEDIKSRLEEYIKHAESLDSVKPIYIVSFLNALIELKNTIKKSDWGNLLGLLSRLAQKSKQQSKNNPDEEDDYNYDSVRRRVVDFIGDAIKGDKEKRIPYQFKKEVWQIIGLLCEDPEPTEEYEDKYGGSNMNPPTLALNTIRGKAMIALVDYALWIAEEKVNEKGYSRGDNLFDPEVQELLDKKLDKIKEISPAVHSVYGTYLPNLCYLNLNWVKNNLSRIFPEDMKYWKAAWGSYVSFTGVYSDVYSMLNTEYKKAINLLPENKVFYKGMGHSPEEALAEHLSVAYLNNLSGLNKEDLIYQYFEKANDHQRSSAVRFIGHIGRQEKSFETNQQFWDNAKALWKLRVELVKRNEPRIEVSEEFTSFIRWVDIIPEDLGEMSEIIRGTLTYCKPQHELSGVFKYLVKHLDKHTYDVLSILDQLMISIGSGTSFYDHENLRQILEAGMRSADSKAKDLSIDCINRFGEWGMYQYRDILDVGKSE
jgi:hypothetical protein